jgi:hypothetical protein
MLKVAINNMIKRSIRMVVALPLSAASFVEPADLKVLTLRVACSELIAAG